MKANFHRELLNYIHTEDCHNRQISEPSDITRHFLQSDPQKMRPMNILIKTLIFRLQQPNIKHVISTNARPAHQLSYSGLFTFRLMASFHNMLKMSPRRWRHTLIREVLNDSKALLLWNLMSLRRYGPFNS